MTPRKVAFVTYNTLPDLQNGWLERGEHAALIAQDTNGRGVLSDGNRTRSPEEIGEEIERLWGQLDVALPELDRLVVYVGASGSLRAIQLAAKVPIQKLTFIGCGCGLDEKEAMIQEFGLGAADRRLCECGGHRTMAAMVNVFLETGTV